MFQTLSKSCFIFKHCSFPLSEDTKHLAKSVNVLDGPDNGVQYAQTKEDVVKIGVNYFVERQW